MLSSLSRSRSGPLESSRSDTLMALRSNPDHRQGQGPAAAITNKTNLLAAAKVKVQLPPPPLRSRFLPPSRSRFLLPPRPMTSRSPELSRSGSPPEEVPDPPPRLGGERGGTKHPDLPSGGISVEDLDREQRETNKQENRIRSQGKHQQQVNNNNYNQQK